MPAKQGCADASYSSALTAFASSTKAREITFLARRPVCERRVIGKRFLEEIFGSGPSVDSSRGFDGKIHKAVGLRERSMVWT